MLNQGWWVIIREANTENFVNHWILVLCCFHLSQKKEANLPVLLKFLSSNYRVRLLPVGVLIFFFPVNHTSMLGNVYHQQSFARCSLYGEVLNQPILYWLRLSLTIYFYFKWCDSCHRSLCLPSWGGFLFFCFVLFSYYSVYIRLSVCFVKWLAYVKERGEFQFFRGVAV